MNLITLFGKTFSSGCFCVRKFIELPANAEKPKQADGGKNSDLIVVEDDEKRNGAADSDDDSDDDVQVITDSEEALKCSA